MRKLTYQEVVHQAKCLGYTVTSPQDQYVNTNTPVSMTCDKCGGSMAASLMNLRRMKRCEGNCKPQKIPFCSIIKLFEDGGCKLLTTESEYTGVVCKVKYICNCGMIDTKTVDTFQRGQRCWKCGKLARQGTNHPRYGLGHLTKGDRNPNWNPALTDEERAARRNRGLANEYRIWRRLVHKRDNWTCQKCKVKSGKLNVHHIQNYATCPDLRFEVSNGITLCLEHHNEFHSKYGKKDNNQSQLDEYLST